MEKSHQLQQWWRLRLLLSFKNATIIVCLFNLITAFFILQPFLSPSSSFPKFSSSQQPNSAQLRYIKESEEIRRAMMPVHLIKRVSEIEKEANRESEAVQLKETKQTAAVDLVSRLNNFRSYSDPGSTKALEEWRKRKMERARQRELGKNGTAEMAQNFKRFADALRAVGSNIDTYTKVSATCAAIQAALSLERRYKKGVTDSEVKTIKEQMAELTTKVEKIVGKNVEKN